MNRAELPDPDQVIVPDVAEPLLGHRFWLSRRHSTAPATLLGPQQGVEWPTGTTLVAECRGSTPMLARRRRAPIDRPVVVRHVSPCAPDDVDTHHGHGCGIYGLRSPVSALAATPVVSGIGALGWPPHVGVVFGDVFLSGRYFEYEDGWRAERGSVAALWEFPADTSPLRYVDRPRLEQLAAAYEVPIIEAPEAAVEHIAEQRRVLINYSMVIGQRHIVGHGGVVPLGRSSIAGPGVYCYHVIGPSGVSGTFSVADELPQFPAPRWMRIFAPIAAVLHVVAAALLAANGRWSAVTYAVCAAWYVDIAQAAHRQQLPATIRAWRRLIRRARR